MTPHELNLHINEHTQKQKADWDEQLTLTYLGASWSRQDRKIPNYNQVIDKEQPQQPKVKTPEDMLAKIKMLNEAFGGSTQ